MIDRIELKKLTDIPIESVASRLGLQVRQRRCLCPFHDDHHASMYLNARTNRFRCYACGQYGRTIDLVMKRLNMGFREACQWLADEENVMLEEYKPTPAKPITFDASRYERYFQHPWLSAEAERFLFEERKLNKAVIRWCKLTSYRDKTGVHWLQIPYFDEEGRLIGLQNRNLDYQKGKEGSIRFRFPTGSRCSIYNLPVLKLLKPHEDLYITEGCSDCWAMLSSGHKAIAIPSATLLKPDEVERISSFILHLSSTLHMYPDQDEPGEQLFRQLKKQLPGIIRHQLPADCKDYSDYFAKA